MLASCGVEYLNAVCSSVYHDTSVAYTDADSLAAVVLNALDA